jgi:predicted phage terminase large subunit-like protein
MPKPPPLSLVEFTERLGYINAPFHEQIYAALTDEKIKRLLIILPPGHGKSTCVTVNYPLWRVGNDHNYRVIAASYAKDFVASFLREITGRMQSPEYIQDCKFGELKPQRGGAQVGYKWASNEIIVQRPIIHKDPTFTALGTGQGTIGRRAHDLIADDIVDEDHAYSETLRERLWSWWKNEFLTRLEPNGRVIVVGTRVHFLDLYGRLLKEKDENDNPLWHIIILPAYDKALKPLWEAKWPLEILLSIKRELGSPVFTAKYLGDPTPQEGATLKREWLNYWTEEAEDKSKRVYKLPVRDRLRIYQAWDLAISEDPSADWTVGLTLGVDMDGGIYLLDYARGHWDFPTQIKQVEAQAAMWSPLKIAIESNAYQKALPQALRAGLLPVVEVKQTRDKIMRIQELSPHFENGAIRISRAHDEFLLEYLQFPKGEHDDILDALHLAFSQVREPSPQFMPVTRSFG